MSPSKFSSNNNASVSSQENGLVDSLSLLNSEKAVQELIKQPLVQGADDHLIEFSDAMRTITKALMQVAEGKASAQAEAAEWKHKYELERERNMQLEHKGNKICAKLGSCCTQASTENATGFLSVCLPCLVCWDIWKEWKGQVSEALSSEEHISELNDERQENFTDQPPLSNEAAEQSERCCWKNGIFSHEVLRDGDTKFDSEVVPCKFMRKASFKLSWCCKVKRVISIKKTLCPLKREILQLQSAAVNRFL